MGLFWALALISGLCFSTSGVHSSADGVKTFIVRVQNDLKPSAFANVENWYASTLRSLTRNPLGSEEEATAFGGDFVHVYKTVFYGFAARLTPQQVDELTARSEVLGVFPDEFRQLQTTRTSEFLGLTVAGKPARLLAESDGGSNVIIGVLDTGIGPERLSFKDEGLGPVPARWKGECVGGVDFTTELCNKKLIGARYFTAGLDAAGPNATKDVKSARDTEGHGTHTASTAAGRQVVNASFLGYAQGVASGVAPKARIAVYKVCWSRGCLNSDLLAAFDKAVEDGVDVISLSIGGGAMPYSTDPIALGAFGAMEKGVFVSASAGNEGPTPSSLSNAAPWITTVGASTIDRTFPADLILENGEVLTGASLYVGKPLPSKTYFPLVYIANGNYGTSTCAPGSLDPAQVRGKIVVCDRGGGSRVGKGKTVMDAGGIGVVVANVAPLGEGIVADPHILPGLDISESAADKLKTYISAFRNPRATIVFRGTQVGVKPAPIVASFSSRGPPESLFVMKPDLIAPGVNILAAWPEGVSLTEGVPNQRRSDFNIISGTSMSCPHVSGLAALLKGAHQDWSPAMIRSALITTAYTRSNDQKPVLDETAYTPATVWDMGAGHVDPEKAVDPGLVYDITVDDYLNFLCASGLSAEKLRAIARRSVNCVRAFRSPSELNYATISVVFNVSRRSKLEQVVTRTATYVSDGPSTYRVAFSNTKNAIVTVRPKTLVFKTKGEKLTYEVRVLAKNVDVPTGNAYTESTSLTWTDGKHRVTSPVVVAWKANDFF
ncbi:subtilisin-like protease SBT1.5 [Malania oleifera]|uniref:subtilisin-like protease SBT1.5 n=1 Tax=Malania oleifera TaxID=397392 RepID=UPI0025ADEB84|nr:subtilisin-like protease SBT1.5 [Malania oleifera]